MADSFRIGFVIPLCCLLLLLISLFLLRLEDITIPNNIDSYYYMFFGVLQFIYVIPLLIVLDATGRINTAKGLMRGAGILVILNIIWIIFLGWLAPT